MKKRVLSLFMALALCLSMTPEVSYAEEAGVVTEQEAKSGESTADVYIAGSNDDSDTTGSDTTGDGGTTGSGTTGNDISGGNASSVSGNDVSGGDANGQDAEKVKAVQALIDDLPNEVTAENMDELEAQMIAIGEALAALDKAQTAKLDMTRYNNICAALTTFVSVQDGVHSHTICGATTCNGHEDGSKHDKVVDNWIPLSYDAKTETLYIDGEKWERTGYYYQLEEGNYYLKTDIEIPSYTPPEGDSNLPSISIKGNVSLCLNGLSITQNNTTSAISVSGSDNSLSLCDCDNKGTGCITKPKGGSAGFGVSNLGSTCIINMYGGIINGFDDAGVKVVGTFNMYGGTITENTCGVASGGHLRGTFNMYGGEITGNTRGIAVLESTYDSNTFNMYDGKITGNSADKGGGVYVKSNGTFTMSGGEITGNSADKGGGVYVDSNGTFTMSGGEITGNNTTENSSGNVYVGSGSFTVSGTAKIQDNWIEGAKTAAGMFEAGGTGTAGNVYLPSGKEITIDKAGLKDGASIGVTYGSTITDDVTIATGAKNGYPIDSITSDNDRYRIWKVDDELRLTTAEVVSHPICGETCNHTEKHSVEMWKGISDLSQITSDGNYYLTGNVLLTGKWYFPSVTACPNVDNVKLCLNGKTIFGKAGSDTILVKEGSSLDITDCQKPIGKITHASGDGCGINVKGTLTLWNGAITGNRFDNGGGVSLSPTGSFTMNGGTITGNNANNNGGGVYLNSSSSFTMNGGTITKNKAGSGGGGVCVDKGGTFIMNSGCSIAGNQSGTNGGGVYVVSSGSFTMNGGTITGNNSTHNSTNTSKNIYSGGVYVASSGIFTVSGEVDITNNWKNGKQNNEGIYEKDPDNTDSKAGNVYLAGVDTTVATITIGAGLTEKAKIGVSKAISNLDAGNVYIIATNATDENMKYTEIFTPDVPDKYFITRDGEGNLKLGMHQHSWTYKLSDDATITATCSNAGTCPGTSGGSTTISKPAHVAYGDGLSANATLDDSAWKAETLDFSTIIYKDEAGNRLGEAPTDAGSYTASITVGGVTASVSYEIAKAAPKADDFNFTPARDLTYDGSAKFAKVVAKNSGMGDVTAVKYYQDGTPVDAPVDAGTYTVKISVAEGTNYNAADVTDETWTFTIESNANAPTVELSDGTNYTYNGKRITPAVTVKVGGKTLTEDKDYTVIYGDNINVGDGTITIRAKGNYGWYPDEVMYFTIEQAEQELSFAESEMAKTYIDKTFTNKFTQTKGDGTVTYASDNTAVATVDKDTGEVTIVGVGTAIITATAATTANYKEGSATYTLKVGKALLHFGEAPRANNKTYDGNTDAKVEKLSFADKNGNPVSLDENTDYTVKGTFSSSNVSISPQNVKVEVTLLGDSAKNYELEAATYEARATIFAKLISIGSATAQNRIYEKNNTSVTIDSVDFAGAVTSLVKGKDYDVVTSEMADADAGTNKVVNVAVALKGDAADNYYLDGDTTTTTVNISQATTVINASNWKTLINNDKAVDISDWASFNNTDDGAKLIYKLGDDVPTGITLENNMLKAENTVLEGSSFAIKVTAKATKNFAEPEVQSITVQVMDKIPVGIEFKNAPDSVTYGDADVSLTAGFTSTATVPADDNGTWSWENSNDSVLEIVSGEKTTTPTIQVKKAGTAFLTVTYTSDTYYGKADVSITVAPKKVTEEMIAEISAQEYTGSAIEPKPGVKDGEIPLTESKDFDYSYGTNINVAEGGTVTITGTGNYTGEITKNFTISPKSISGATIVLDVKSFAYTGSKQTVSITSVTLEGWSKEITYDIVSGDTATDAGTVTLTIEGTGNYTGEAATTWEITKIDPELANFDVTGLTTETYNGKAKTVTATAKTGTRGMGDVTVIYKGVDGTTYLESTTAPTNAGSYAVTIVVSEGTNYNATTIEVGTLVINKATITRNDIKKGYKYTQTGVKKVELADLVADATDYTLGAVTGDTGIISGYSVGTDGVLKYTLTGKGKIGNTVTLPVTISSVNYKDVTVNVIITLKARDDQEALVITGANTVVYGETLTLGTKGGSGTGKVTYRIDEAKSTGEADIDENGVLKPKKVGKITVIATKAEDVDYNEASSKDFVIEITQATPTGEPGYTKITTGGKTLADAGLTAGELNPAVGTLEWIDDAGNVLNAEETTVEVNTEYTWRFTPDDSNYDILTGRIELYHVDMPAISSQPKDASVKAGERAVFEVTATGTDLTYQWQIDRNDGKGFVDLYNATGASYTSGVTDRDCNGFQYQCIISNAAGSVTTETATLTVTVYYTVTATAGEHGSISPSGAVEVAEGSNQTFTITADEGYEIESLKVDGAAAEAAASYTFTDVKETHTIEVTFKRAPYRITDGADSAWTQNVDGSLVIRGNGEYADFQKVLVDGTEIDPVNYTATQGSTIITLKPEFLSTLSEGSHTFAIVWRDGSADTHFTVARNSSGNNNNNNNNSNNNSSNDNAGSDNTEDKTVIAPKTGDASKDALMAVLVVVSFAGLAGMLVLKKRNAYK